MKKIISVFLIIATLVAMLPTGVVLASDKPAESYEYKFTATAIGQTKNTNIYNGTKLAGYGFGNVKDGNSWKLVQVLGGASKESVQANKSNFVIFAAQSASSSAEADANAIVFQLYLGDYGTETPATSGTYTPTITNPQDGGQNHYGITDLYLVSSAAVSKNSWKINSIEEVQKIID
ncbi:MAG: hypothetical protein IJP38_05795, partial [Oscillospiraceae bacterium]|nr:hypothetical protein [Oscillospiraceae bacterium]